MLSNLTDVQFILNKLNLYTAPCKEGCDCIDGFVLNQETNECVEETSCPCFYGGNSYPSGYSFTQDCSTL